MFNPFQHRILKAVGRDMEGMLRANLDKQRATVVPTLHTAPRRPPKSNFGFGRSDHVGSRPFTLDGSWNDSQTHRGERGQWLPWPGSVQSSSGERVASHFTESLGPAGVGQGHATFVGRASALAPGRCLCAEYVQRGYGGLRLGRPYNRNPTRVQLQADTLRQHHRERFDVERIHRRLCSQPIDE